MQLETILFDMTGVLRIAQKTNHAVLCPCQSLFLILTNFISYLFLVILFFYLTPPFIDLYTAHTLQNVYLFHCVNSLKSDI